MNIATKKHFEGKKWREREREREKRTKDNLHPSTS
jgi:hypothetical protein